MESDDRELDFLLRKAGNNYQEKAKILGRYVASLRLKISKMTVQHSE
jgi:hypothetical protein